MKRQRRSAAGGSIRVRIPTPGFCKSLSVIGHATGYGESWLFVCMLGWTVGGDGVGGGC